MASPPTTTKTKVTLTGVPETLLVTLAARNWDFHQPRPILNDPWAARIMSQIDYDFQRIPLSTPFAANLVQRSNVLETWTTNFLHTHADGEKPVTVLHLGCGFDARALRLQEKLRGVKAGVRWVDVDLPEVADLRRGLDLPVPEMGPKGEYRLDGASVMDLPAWLDDIPVVEDGPVLMVAEGLLSYLKEEDVRAVIGAVVDRFKHGQLVFDALTWYMLALQWGVTAIMRTGAKFHWGLKSANELEGWRDGIKLVDHYGQADKPGFDKLGWTTWIRWRFISWLPFVNHGAYDVRYEF